MVSAIATKQQIPRQVIDEGFTYGQYRQLIDKLLEREKTTGDKQSEQMVEYSRMNVHRMNRLDDQIELKDSLVERLEKLDRKWVWLVLTEGWCGDAAQNVPAMNKMAEVTSNIELKFILRDEHPEIMEHFLTDGSRSIPKLICLDAETLEVIGSWGPRPQPIQEKALQWKDDPGISNREWGEKLHKWYADNQTREIQEEFEALLEQWR